MRDLTEAEYRHRTNVYDDLSKYAGHGYFVHFGDTPKIGVKPNPYHSDPAGVYYYSLDWLLLNPRFYNEGTQYAVDRRYWTVVKLVSNNGIVFSELTFDKLNEIAARNNFQKWELFLKVHNKIEYEASRSPAIALWDYIKQHRKDGSRPLAGIDFIYDDGLGVIHHREPNQLLVINPRAISVVAKGENLPEQAQPDYLIIKVLKNIQLRYGGDITWQNKEPRLLIDRGYTKFLVTYEKRDQRLRLKMNWGRAEKTTTIPLYDIQYVISFTETLGKIERLFDNVIRLGKAKKDLFFEPEIDPKEVLVKLRLMVTEGFTFETLILNENKEIIVTAHRDLKIDGVNIITVITCRISDDPRWNLRVAINSYPFAQSVSLDHFPKELVSSASQTVDRFTETKKPSSGDPNWYLRHFYNEREYRAFVGWAAMNSGLRNFTDNFEKEIIEYNSLSADDKKYLTREIKRVF